MKKSNTASKKALKKPKKIAQKKEAKSVLHPQSRDIFNQLQKDSENSSNDKILIKYTDINSFRK